jgi:hypothetical protein
VLAQFGIRIEPQMSQYVLEQLAGGSTADASFPIMGGDARTGAPVRRFIRAAAFLDSASDVPPASAVTH